MTGQSEPRFDPPIRLIWQRIYALADRLLRLAGLRRARLRRFSLEQPLSEAVLALAEQQQRPPEEVAAELLVSGLVQHDRQSEAWQRWEALSTREQQVAVLVCQGYTSRQVAARLQIAEETARTHVRNILRRFNLHSRNELRMLFEGWDFKEL
jgi:DNA-binding NarL/FixJ family response regulator